MLLMCCYLHLGTQWRYGPSLSNPNKESALVTSKMSTWAKMDPL